MTGTNLTTSEMKDTSNTASALGSGDPVGSSGPRHIRRSTSGTSWSVIDPAAPQAATTVVKRFNVRFTRFLMRNPTALKRLTSFEEASVSGLPKLIRIAMEAGQLTMLAEGINGEPLDEAIAKRRVGTDPAIAINIILNLAEGLIAMHAGGLVHGDIRTATITVDPEAGHAQFADWGHVVPFGGDDRDDVGPKAFDAEGIPIEEASLRPADDVYGLACVAYELLSGRHPYWHRTDAEAKEFGLGPVPLVNVDDVTNDALMQALVRSSDARYISMQGFADVLKADSRRRDRMAPASPRRSRLGKSRPLTAITGTVMGVASAFE